MWDRALGLITPDSGHHKPVRFEREPCEKIARDDLDPGALTIEMVEGSKPPRMPEGANNVNGLQRFLKTRSVPASACNKADLVRSVKQLLGLEEKHMADGQWVRLRDPDGGCLHTYLRDKRGRHFPHLVGGLEAPGNDSAEWIMGSTR